MKKVINVLFCVLSAGLFASEVRWDCFALHDSGEANCIGCYYYDSGYSSPEIGLRYAYAQSGAVCIDGKGTANVGWNVAIWVDAVAGDVLDRSYFSQSHVVLKDSYNKLVPSPIELNSIGDALDICQGDLFYLALIGNYYDDDGMPSDYYGWVEMENTGSEIIMRNSAFSYGSIVVGGGAIPEPTATVLLLVGFAALLLRRDDRGRSELDTSNRRIKIRPRTLA